MTPMTGSREHMTAIIVPRASHDSNDSIKGAHDSNDSIRGTTDSSGSIKGTM